MEVSNKEMTFLERIYVWTILKGLWTTLKHLFRRKVTIKYPEEVREMSPIARLQHMLMRDEEGKERCTACCVVFFVVCAKKLVLKKRFT